MATTLPQFIKTIDNAFVETWYSIKAKATDNILLATVVMAALKTKGSFRTQIGSKIITETVKYANPVAEAIEKGDLMPGGETETETMAQWTWRKTVAGLQRSLIDDQENSGEYQIKSYVTKRLQEARDSISQLLETDLLRAEDTTETAHKHIQSLRDIVPNYANRATGTYGKIARSNDWWQPKYQVFTAPKEVNLLTDMKHLYNTIGANQDYPNLIISSQTLFELYEEFALDQAQIVKGSGDLADLGFETLKFKGQDMIWTPNVTTAVSGDNEMFMFNTKFIHAVYDPRYWFEMTPWKYIPNQLESLAQIIAICNFESDQLRRHGALYNA